MSLILAISRMFVCLFVSVQLLTLFTYGAPVAPLPRTGAVAVRSLYDNENGVPPAPAKHDHENNDHGMAHHDDPLDHEQETDTGHEVPEHPTPAETPEEPAPAKNPVLVNDPTENEDEPEDVPEEKPEDMPTEAQMKPTVKIPKHNRPDPVDDKEEVMESAEIMEPKKLEKTLFRDEDAYRAMKEWEKRARSKPHQENSSKDEEQEQDEDEEEQEEPEEDDRGRLAGDDEEDEEDDRGEFAGYYEHDRGFAWDSEHDRGGFAWDGEHDHGRFATDDKEFAGDDEYENPRPQHKFAVKDKTEKAKMAFAINEMYSMKRDKGAGKQDPSIELMMMMVCIPSNFISSMIK